MTINSPSLAASSSIEMALALPGSLLPLEAYMTKLLKLNLLKDVKAMTPEERTASRPKGHVAFSMPLANWQIFTDLEANKGFQEETWQCQK